MLAQLQPIGLVMNPAAGSVSDGDAVFEWFRQNDLRFIECRVEGDRGASQAARELAEQGAAVVVACGGDGTFHHVVNGLRGWLDRVAIAVLPGGTGNDFARSIGTPEALDEALAQLSRGSLHPIDLGECNGELFLNVVSIGAGAEITQATSAELKRWLGRLAYLVTGLQMITSLEPMTVRVCRLAGDHEAETIFTGEAYYLAVANAAYAGGGVSVCPEARIDDGALDLAVVDGLPTVELLRDDLPSSVGAWRTVDGLRISADRDLRISVDGEAAQGCRFQIRVRPAAAQLLVPLWTFDSPSVFSRPVRRNPPAPAFSNPPVVS